MSTQNPFRHLMAVIFALGCAAAAVAQDRQPNQTNQLHMKAKPAVVRILTGYTGQWVWRNRQWQTNSISSGSGFIINPNGYIVTNAHVVDDIKKGDDHGKQILLNTLAQQALESVGQPVTQYNIANAAQFLSQQAELVSFQRINFVFLQSGHRYPYEIKAFGAPIGAGKDLLMGKDVAVIKIEVKNAPTLKLGNSDQVQVGDAIWVIGYPAAGDSDALDEKSALEPTTNDGKISARKNSADGAPVLQTNTSTTHGNSGGPAINDKGEVIGMLTFRGNTVNGQEVQGFNFLVPVNTATEFVRQAGTEYKESPIDKLWNEGLQNYWQQHYSSAKENFANVVALFPDHNEAQKLITESQERIAKGEDKSGFNFEVTGWKALPIIGFVLMIPVAGIAGLIFLLKQRNIPIPVVDQILSALKPRSSQSVSPTGHSSFGMPQPVPAMAGVAPATFSRTERLNAPAPTERLDAVKLPKLVCTAGALAGQEFIIVQDTYIGRDQSRAQIVPPESKVSGHHLLVQFINGRLTARDLGSTNGTFLNRDSSKRITETELKDGDVLTLGGQGSAEFTVRF
ncbi:MAG TPA: trypsin-like peptidase domain-containing protein [Blastocatellia bacterium]|nr:trypsin-like peptidase domain-containing protein [Blastocatellia bacterium]